MRRIGLRGGRPYRQRQRRVDGRGQSMVEFALVAPVFFVLLYASLEMGMLFKTSAAFQEAAQRAVTVATAAGQDGNADTETLHQLQMILAGEDLSKITAVKIYDANVVPSTTNTYTTYQYDPGVGFICAGTVSAPVLPPNACPTSYWSPAVRSTKVGTLGNSLTRVGVQITFDYKGMTGLFPTLHMTQIATALMEPTQY